MESKKIKEKLFSIAVGEPFTAKKFQGISNNKNVRKLLSRLVDNGEIKRLCRGVYIRPKFIGNMGEKTPSIQQILKKITKITGETIVVHPAESQRILKLSKQIPLRPIFLTNGTSRTIVVGNSNVQLKHVSPKKLVAANTVQGHVFSALMYLGKEKITQEQIKKIQSVIGEDEFNKIYSFLDKVPAWLADIFYYFKYEKS
tara:strand:- start:685 stop:1284 length:600 start_codon:yes stop_codon:yes gene_type:complete